MDLSLRTVQRVLRGEIQPVASVSGVKERASGGGTHRRDRGEEGPVLVMGEEEREEIAAILGRSARAGYLEVEDVQVEARPGEISVRARVYEPEEEYE